MKFMIFGLITNWGGQNDFKHAIVLCLNHITERERKNTTHT